MLLLLCLVLAVDGNEISLVQRPANNSHLHYIKNDTNSTSLILSFAQNVDLPLIDGFDYFLCYQIFSENDSLQNETKLKCFDKIPNHPFNISDLVNGTYHIHSSLILVSQSNKNKMTLFKEERITFYIREMINFHATYEWQQIESHHAVHNGLDIKMDIFNDSNGETIKLVKIPSIWSLQLFISPSYRLLHLYVSKNTHLSSVKHQISIHTGIDYGCIDIIDKSGRILTGYQTIESVDWFYQKYQIFVALDPSTFCQPAQCGFGYLNEDKVKKQSGKCDGSTIKYKQKYVKNKGNMHIDISIASDSLLRIS